MRAVIFLLFGLLAVASTADQKKVVCYFGSWAVYRVGNGNFPINKINPHLCTHLIYSFIGLNEDGTVKILDAWADLPNGKDGYTKFNQLRQENPKLKTMIAMGGWNEGSTKYSQVIGNPQLRAVLVKSIVNFVDKYGFDGFDLDWEYPGQRGGSANDKYNLVELLKELRSEFDSRGWLLSAAVAASMTSASQSYDIPQLSKYLDFINLMEYDFHDSSEPTTGHNSPLYSGSHESYKDRSVDSSVQYWIQQGASPEKLVMGIPTYGKGFQLADSSNTGVNAPARGASSAGPYTQQAGMLGYNEICEKVVDNKWTVQFDNEQRVPYVYGDGQWLSFDNKQSIAEKGNYVKENNLGGMMIWSIETDDFLGKCGEGEYPILTAINQVLNGQSLTSKSHQVNKSQSIKKQKIVPTTQATWVEKPKHRFDPPKSSSNDVCQESGLNPHPNKCDSFYVCEPLYKGFTATEMKCPHNLHYNPRLKVCDYPFNAKCQLN